MCRQSFSKIEASQPAVKEPTSKFYLKGNYFKDMIISQLYGRVVWRENKDRSDCLLTLTKISVFLRPHDNRETVFSKNSSLYSIFEKFLVTIFFGGIPFRKKKKKKRKKNKNKNVLRRAFLTVLKNYFSVPARFHRIPVNRTFI